MFITRELSPLELVSEFVKLSHFEDCDTKSLRDLKHNRDLCPKFQEVIESIMGYYSAFRVSTMDIQGFKDRGCDVLVQSKRETPDGYVDDAIGFQIKSHREVSDWWGSKTTDSLPAKLKLQFLEATKSLKVEHYFIVLCVDVSTHRDAVRHITAEFVDYPQVTVVTPRNSLSLLRLSDPEIYGMAASLLCEGDAVVMKAHRELKRFSDFMKHHITSSLFAQLEGETGVIEINLDSVPEQYQECVQNELAELAWDDLEWCEAGNGWRAMKECLSSVIAVYYDAKARLNISSELAIYVQELLDIDPSDHARYKAFFQNKG